MVIDLVNGIARQSIRARLFEYGDAYFTECVRRADTEIGRRLNAGRAALVERYCTKIIDIGIGCGAFIEATRLLAIGFDINPLAIAWLKSRSLFHDPWSDGIPSDVDGVTLWDVLEHMPEPEAFLRLIPAGVYMFVSLPIFTDLRQVERSKHFKPDEHLWYFTEAGILGFVRRLGFSLVDVSDHETKAGRESIKTFVVKR